MIYLIWVHSHIVPRLYNAWLNRKLMDKLNEGKLAFVEFVHQLAVQPGVVEPRYDVAMHPNQVDHRHADDEVGFRPTRAAVDG
ncbi:hypothetical protein ER21_12775 [Cronobacter sakazakii]|nr:hypothetical protein ER21_12775 [Cronobacter sakazakii]